MNSSLPHIGRRMAKGAAWLAFLRFSMRAIGLVSTIILARLLVPEDFGLVAMATMVTGLIEVMGEFGFDLVLIRRQDTDRRYYDTVWTMAVIRGAVLAGAMALVAGMAAEFFNEPRVNVIIYCLAAVTLVQGLTNVGVVDFRKDLTFNKEFMFLLVPRLGSFVVTVTLATLWRSYWALVAGIVTAGLLQVASSYVMHPYRPRFSLSVWREVMNFAKWLVLNNAVNVLRRQADRFIIGKLAATEALGLYFVGQEVATLPTTQIIGSMRRVLYPGFSKMVSEEGALRKGFVAVTALTFLVGAPLSIGIAAVAGPLVHVVLGEKWTAVIPLIPIVAVTGLIEALGANSSSIYLALGRPKIVALLGGFGIVVTVPLLVFGVKTAGIIGAAWAVLIGSVLTVSLNFAVVSRLLDLRWATLLAATWRPFAAVSLMTVVVTYLLSAWDSLPAPASHVIELAVAVTLGAVIYIGVEILLWRWTGTQDGVENYVLSAVKSLFQRR